MALYQMCLLPNLGHSKILQTGQAKSPSLLKTKCSYILRPIQSMAPTVSAHAIPRRSANFGSSVWDYDFLQSLTSEFADNELYAEQRNQLKEEVRMMLCKMKNPLFQLELIDDLQRLGLAYHFNNEINIIVDTVYKNMDSFMEENLYFTALKFRLLRQNGYHISAEVFDCFQDGECDFKESLSFDIDGILSFYEATFYSFQNEIILQNARDFCLKHLKEFVKKCGHTELSLLVTHALEIPLHWRMLRLEARWFIDFYGRKKSMIHSLLKLAKLDFNMVQTIHQEDLKHASRWWEKAALREKMSFSRDRLVECFIWTVGYSFQPHFGYFRRIMTKVNALITIIDDVYDVYGTLEELELFTDVVGRWDMNAMDTLPEYMKICFLELYNFVDEFARDTLKETGHQIHPYLAKVWEDLCKAYLIEAKWYFNGYTPSQEEYIENGWISIAGAVALIHAYFSAPNPIRKKDLKYLEKYSNILHAASTIVRLPNDLGTYKREMETGDIPKSIQCYMHETGASEAYAREHIKSIICTTWKKINEDVNSGSYPENFIEIVVNSVRMSLCMYQYGDAFSIQDQESKKWISSLLFEAIPIA
ncbi:hypothetical protein L6164_023740 [Bauhinia variegata]|uniref:Uncharacterized protein n=1 Tax=Bauhinia variegata TaxID=167791 RepID=A0ACB9MKJ9_BAUVA|nr:hypothetical protein L6164_023740 [Bauhinia variegata]